MNIYAFKIFDNLLSESEVYWWQAAETGIEI